MVDTPRLILDIGTHKVLGLAVRPTEDGVEVLASSMRTHGGRAMRDGQVHDVPAVSRTVRAVVHDIEARLGGAHQGAEAPALGGAGQGAEAPAIGSPGKASVGPSGNSPRARSGSYSSTGPDDRAVDSSPFTEAYIAAAGRALQTARGRAELVEARPVFVTAEMQRALEWDAVADAQANLLAALPRTDHDKGFYCIAHSRTDSRIDGEPIASLIDQRGSRISVEVLATFLPGIVVDSLQAVLRNAGLKMRGLTLEPVAALEAVVPETMRHLRLMLVDVGAGTTDIAFTGDGTVQAYGMAPLGGDSLTEALANQFLLDFTVAEAAKQSAANGHTTSVRNVLGDTVVIDPSILVDAVQSATAQLAKAVGRIAETWDLEMPPDAVLLVGGGSNTPRLPEMLAAELHLAPHRIAVRDRGAIRSVVGEDSLQGPEVVTALGIALRFQRDDDLPPVRVRVNGRPVSLFQPERCTVREAARIAGLPLTHLVGRFGQGMTVTVNGELLIIPGRRGRTAAVQVNGAPATLDTLLQMNDDVRLELPVEGDAARLTVSQLVEQWRQQRRAATGRDLPSIVWNGVRHPMPLLIRRRGEAVSTADIVLDRDEFEFRWPRTIAELLDSTSKTGSTAGVATISDGAGDAARDGAVSDGAGGTGSTAIPAMPAKAAPLGADVAMRHVAGPDEAHAAIRAAAEGAATDSDGAGEAARDGAVSDGTRGTGSTAIPAMPAKAAPLGADVTMRHVAGPDEAHAAIRAAAEGAATDSDGAGEAARDGANVDGVASDSDVDEASIPTKNEGNAAGPRAAQSASAVADPSPFARDRVRPFPIVLNGTPTAIDLPPLFRRNGSPVGLSARIEDGDRIDVETRTSVQLYELLSHPRIDALRRVAAGKFGVDGEPMHDPTFRGDMDVSSPGDGGVVGDIGPRKLILLVRGEPAGFTTVVHARDRVDIRYE